MTFVMRLDEDECADPDLVGGKALNLGHMTRAGLPVPRWHTRPLSSAVTSAAG